MSYTKVETNLVASSYGITKILKDLSVHKLLSFDTETRSVYTKDEVKAAKTMLKDEDDIRTEDLRLVKLVAKSSGLSYPSLIKTTHFIFGLSPTHSVVIITNSINEEMKIWYWVINFKNKLIIHNSMFDLKICYQRTGKIPIDFVDTMLLAKTLINNADNWKAKVGLKDLMGSEYDPKWSLYNNYDVENLKDEDFISYCGIDGAATFGLYNELQKFIGEE